MGVWQGGGGKVHSTPRLLSPGTPSLSRSLASCAGRETAHPISRGPGAGASCLFPSMSSFSLFFVYLFILIPVDH